MIIAIDGHSSCGKSTLAKELAETLQIRYIDSGAMYRAVTYCVLQSQIDYSSSERLEQCLAHIDIVVDKDQVWLNGKDISRDIRSQDVSQLVSEISTISTVRRKLVDLQRQMAAQDSIVMDGRDIGTVVFPSADLKLFITASIEIRTDRRFKELVDRGFKVTREEVKKNLNKRDHIDSTRLDSPLKKAEDSILIDNTDLTKTEQLQLALDIVRSLPE